MRIQRGIISQLRERLETLHAQQYNLTHGVDGITLEYTLEKVGRLCASTPGELFHQYSLIFDSSFSPDQKMILYKIMVDLLESAKSKGVDWNRVFDPSTREP